MNLIRLMTASRKPKPPAKNSRQKRPAVRKRLNRKSGPDRKRTHRNLQAPGFDQLVEIMRILRSPGGCPWDREQDFDTIKPYTLEETYEVLEAIDARDWESLKEELGDLLFQVVFYAQMASERKLFDIEDVTRTISRKMVERHPHVFGDAMASTAQDVVVNWEAIKRREKANKRDSVLDGIPAELPALVRASRLGEKAARVGYDWPDRNMLWDKLEEETGELVEAIYGTTTPPRKPARASGKIRREKPVSPPARRAHVEEELGDVLFVVANIARRFHISAEDALRKSNEKFYRRFRHIEMSLKAEGIAIENATLEQMEKLYQQARKAEGKQPVRS